MAKHAQIQWQARLKAMARCTQMWWIKTVLTTKRTKKIPILSPATIKWFFLFDFRQLFEFDEWPDTSFQLNLFPLGHVINWVGESFWSLSPTIFLCVQLGKFGFKLSLDAQVIGNHNYINQCRPCVYVFVYVSHKYTQFSIDFR